MKSRKKELRIKLFKKLKRIVKTYKIHFSNNKIKNLSIFSNNSCHWINLCNRKNNKIKNSLANYKLNKIINYKKYIKNIKIQS